MARMRKVIGLLITMLVLASFAMPSAAERIVAGNFQGQSIDLLTAMQAVDSDSKTISIDVLADTSGQKVRMPLTAKGLKAPYRWAIFTLTNPSGINRDYAIVVPKQGFERSGIIWPLGPRKKLIQVRASTGAAPTQLGVRHSQAYAISLAPGQTVSYAIELTQSSLNQVSLWHRNKFDQQQSQVSFFNGVILGISVLLGVGILSLFIIRPVAVFPAAGLFAWSLIGFLFLNAGFMSALPASIATDQNELLSRVVIEGLMLIGLALTFITFLELSKHARIANVIMWILAFSGVGLIGFGFAAPNIALGLIRIVFVIAVLLALAVAVSLYRQQKNRARTSLLVWIVLAIWTLVAAYGVLGKVEKDAIAPVIAAGVVLILVTIGFTVAQLAFGRSMASRRFLEDSGRRALALAGSEQSVWDWQIGHELLYIGPELERALGLQAGSMGGTNLNTWIDIIHPADRGAYVATVEAAERRGKGAFSQQFRLRRADGSYRWFLLRARAILDEDLIASRLIGTLTDVTAVKRAEDCILADAVRDRVTGLPNKALFYDRLERAMRRCGTTGSSELFVLVIDLDRFKNVNDGLGHEVGDSLLNVTANRLARMIGPDDTLARLAGDQFGIIFNGDTPEREIISVADSIRQIIAMPINVRPREIFLTASIGVAQIEHFNTPPEGLIKNAEIALYEAKRQGKDHIEFYNPAMLDDRSNLVALENDLRRAIDRGEIEVLYQPIKRLVDDELAGFEALVRWRHPTRGLLSPDAFIAMAEETGIIKEVGRYVLNEAARQLGVWQRAFRPSDPLFVAVNVSSAQLLNYELVSDLRALLAREDIVPGTLKLELTETLVMQNPELSGKVLEHAVGLGVGLACDDFGTGYSALANLRRLPFDTLKIDRAFLEDDGVDERATIIFDAITHLAHNLNLNVVAEGVETLEQEERLRLRGCDYAQGFFIGEPVSKERVIEALGGLPYTSDKSTLAQLWDRLLGKEVEKEKIQSAMPSREEQAADVEELQSLEEPLEPWTPESEDVYDAVLEGQDALHDVPAQDVQTQDTPATDGGIVPTPDLLVYPPIETPTADSVDLISSAPLDEDVPQPKGALKSQQEDITPEPVSVPLVGAAPMAPRASIEKVEVDTREAEDEPTNQEKPVQPRINLPKRAKPSDTKDRPDTKKSAEPLKDEKVLERDLDEPKKNVTTMGEKKPRAKRAVKKKPARKHGLAKRRAVKSVRRKPRRR